jgi:hypothetical protein
MNDNVQKDQDVSLETLHLLARVVARTAAKATFPRNRDWSRPIMAFDRARDAAPRSGRRARPR